MKTLGLRVSATNKLFLHPLGRLGNGAFVAVCIVTVNESSGILDIEIDKLTGNEQIYDAQGKKQNSIKKGLNIIRMGDGTTRKVVVK